MGLAIQPAQRRCQQNPDLAAGSQIPRLPNSSYMPKLVYRVGWKIPAPALPSSVVSQASHLSQSLWFSSTRPQAALDRGKQTLKITRARGGCKGEGVPFEPAPVSTATTPKPVADVTPPLPEREGSKRVARLGTPTPEPGRGGWVASLPAGPLPGQLVTFPGRPARC